MSGHSKWHRIKHQKQKEDKKRGKIFSKLSKKIAVAARKGKDPEKNLDLKHAISEAQDNDMPKENIERAILKGSGELSGVEYVETTYEGYGPGGVALFIECTTDNKNRTTADIRHILEKYGGKLGSKGCVSYLFEEKGLIFVPVDDVSETEVYDAAIESEALDIKKEEDIYEIQTEPDELHKVHKSLEGKNIPIQGFELTCISKVEKNLEGNEARRLLKLLSELEDHDDVQKVYSNFNIPDSIMAEMGS